MLNRVIIQSRKIEIALLLALGGFVGFMLGAAFAFHQAAVDMQEMINLIK